MSADLTSVFLEQSLCSPVETRHAILIANLPPGSFSERMGPLVQWLRWVQFELEDCFGFPFCRFGGHWVTWLQDEEVQEARSQLEAQWEAESDNIQDGTSNLRQRAG